MSEKKTEKERNNDENEQKEAAYTVSCPYCGEVFAELDEDGCSINDDELDPCEDLIGQGEDNEFYFSERWELFNEIMDRYQKIENTKEVDAYIHDLTGVDFHADIRLFEFLKALPEVTLISNVWSSSPGASGYSSYVTVDRKSQAGLLTKLTSIRDRLKRKR